MLTRPEGSFPATGITFAIVCSDQGMKPKRRSKKQFSGSPGEEHSLDPEKTMEQVNRELDRKKVQIEILRKILEKNPNTNL